MLAEHLKVKRILIFTRDRQTDTFLLAYGISPDSDRTLDWKEFLGSCITDGTASTDFREPKTGETISVFGLSDLEGQCILVFFGGRPEEDEILALQVLLPFLCPKLADERVIREIAAHESDAVEKGAIAGGDTRYQELLATYERTKRELIYRREAENKLRVADRRKDEFIATVSHELRTPLNAVLGWAEVLRIKAAKDPSMQKGVDAIIRSAKSQANLISELLDTSTIVVGKLVLHLEPVDLADVLERACETVEPLAQQKNIRIHMDVDLRETLNGDSTRLRQVFWNLLCNAVKFTQDGGMITVKASCDEMFSSVIVTDNGLGIEADFLPYVFDRFRQADASLRRKYGGLGLGLAIAKQFIEMHGGTISVSSEGIGKGTSFAVRLPHAASALSNIAGSPSTSKLNPVDLKTTRILVVDDDPDARELTAKTLQDFGAYVKVLASPIDALSLLEEEHLDLLISDIAMPYLDGITFIERIRSFKNPDRAKIPALALTAFSDAAQIRMARASGFNMVLTKPVSAIELARAVNGLIAAKS